MTFLTLECTLNQVADQKFEMPVRKMNSTMKIGSSYFIGNTDLLTVKNEGVFHSFMKFCQRRSKRLQLVRTLAIDL